ncbi:alpha-L-arabinofuranosidase [Mucilaginibacter sp.]|uniref:alpha-L-arabinofuranosidase n=1 Tax=Mucilaginibacter sp. TaxID=1882438 RepID=UPI00283E4DAF|nr:alpha-L-arabinofuranosidase [Mucilaginibacter sp.]MDR3696425.1 alpha-L-arabinofuranosidase [Mucilaginibacter sp.]
MKNINKTALIVLTAIVVAQSCKKEPNNSGGGTTTTTTDTTPGTGVGTGPGGSIVAGTDPSVAATQGFFLDNWQGKTFAAPTSQSVSKPSAGSINVTVDLSQITTKVSKLVFGNNTNPFMGQYVDQPALMSNLTALAPNILRAPGGSLSDVYFFDGDGNGNVQAPADAPTTLLDLNGTASSAGYWFGNNTQSWTFSLDNYYKVLQQTNSTGLITVNYGYARYGTGPTPVQTAARLSASWVRYDKGRTTYWEVGNENYGNWEAGYRIDPTKNQDGQPAIITGTLYGTHFKVFADSMRAAAIQAGNNNIKIGIVLTTTNDANNNAGVTNWNRDVLAAAGNSADFFVVHNYYTPYADNSSAAVILNTPVPSTSAMMSWVKTSAQNAGVTQKPVAMDEWNIQATGSSQDVSNVAGLHAVMVLGEALKNQMSMTSRWDLANGYNNGDDQGMFSNSSGSGAEPGAPAWNPRPAFYYMYFFQKYFGDRMVSSTVSGSSDIVSYGSTFSSGEAGVVLVNQSSEDHVVNVAFNNYAIGTKYYYYTLNGGTDNTPFSHNVLINGVGPASGKTGGPASYATVPAISQPVSGGIIVTVPAYGAVYLVADKK